MTNNQTLRHGHGFRKGDRVRVNDLNPMKWLVGKTGTLIKTPAVGKNPILRVRLDGERTEVDATAEKFDRLSEPHMQ